MFTLAVKETNIKTVRALGVSWKRFSMLMQISGKAQDRVLFSLMFSLCVCVCVIHSHTNMHVYIYFFIKPPGSLSLQ